ncbi:hypothetical protein ABBQ32_012572 [Trebouxia sp. C0010 RCD-2024]
MQTLPVLALQHDVEDQARMLDNTEDDDEEEWSHSWSCKSPHASYAYPPDAAKDEAKRPWSAVGVPDNLLPVCTSVTCQFGHTYQHVLINAKCIVLYPDPCGGRTLPLYELRCTARNPDCTVAYDGFEDGLFHYSNATCVSLRLLHGYANQLVLNGQTLKGNVAVQGDSCEQLVMPLHDGTAVKFCTDKTFREIFQARAVKLDLQYAFGCPVCGESPDVLIGDATSVSILGKYYHGDSVESVNPEDHTRYERTYTKAERTLLPEVASRKLLFRFASYARGDNRTAFGHRCEQLAFQYVLI